MQGSDPGLGCRVEQAGEAWRPAQAISNSREVPGTWARPSLPVGLCFLQASVNTYSPGHWLKCPTVLWGCRAGGIANSYADTLLEPALSCTHMTWQYICLQANTSWCSDIALSSKLEELGPLLSELDQRFEFLTMLPGMDVFIAALDIAMNLKFLQGRGMSHSSCSVLWAWWGGTSSYSWHVREWENEHTNEHVKTATREKLAAPSCSLTRTGVEISIYGVKSMCI